MTAKTGTGKLDLIVSGAWSRVALKTGVVAVSEFTGGGGIAERGRATLVGRASGVKRVWRVRTGLAISARTASGEQAARFKVTVSSSFTGGGTKRIVKAFDLPDSSPWYSHAVAARQITRGSTGGVLGNFLGAEYTATFDGMNTGENGHAGGSWERRLYEEGNFTLSFPNREGPDGKLHRERFRPMTKTEPAFRPGDEWIEIYDRGDLVYTGLTRGASVSLQEVKVGGADGAWLLRKTREYWAGYWNHAPRDVWEHYLSLWKMVISDDFNEDAFTYLAAEQTTDDGKWVYLRITSGLNVPASSVEMIPDGPTGGDQNVRCRIRAADSYAFPIGLSEETLGTAWRVECQFWRNRFGTAATPDDGDNAYVRVGMWDLDANDALCVVQMQESYAYVSPDGGHTLWRAAKPPYGDDTFQMVLEGRDRWIYAFINQHFIGSIPMPEGAHRCVPFVGMRPGESTDHQRVRVQNFSCRRTIPYLRPASSHFGDYRLPGSPTPGGIKGTYFNDMALKGQDMGIENVPLYGPNPHHYELSVFSPWAKVNSGDPNSRIDSYIDFSTATTDPYGADRLPYQIDPPTWASPGATTTEAGVPTPQIPSGTAGKWFSVRWTGSVYLPLGQSDCQIGVSTAGEGFRLWIAKTRFLDCAIDKWLNLPSAWSRQSTGSLRAHIGPEADGTYHDGWYPILFEYGERDSAVAGVKLDYDIGGGWRVIPPEHLSPMGIFDEHIRMDSHWEILNTLSETFGYQYTCEPRQFESGEFPGVLAPKVRVGRDTEKIVDDINAANYQVKVTGDTVADAILSDGTGLGSDNFQTVFEAINYLTIGDSLFIQSEYESWGDMNWEEVLAQRATSLLALRESAWEEVEAQPFGAPEMLDSFQLTGELALFRWEPGDGVRIVLPIINVEDPQPRQILGVSYPFAPEGRMGPAVSFKARPRGFREFIRRVQRQYMQRQRTYQGQIVATTGSLAQFGPETTGIDQYSRVILPNNMDNVIRAEVVVTEKTDDSEWYLWINDEPTKFPPVKYPGKYDISGYISRWHGLPIMRVEFRTTSTL